jgi:uncharacterized protein YrzB (UPF0473 family)
MMDELLQGYVLLTDEDGKEEEYHVLRVLEMAGAHYVLLSSEVNPDEEPLILRVEGDIEAEEASLVGILDDEEWERVAEAFDELMFELDDQS